MKLSIITPVHKTSAPFLVEAHESLCENGTQVDWEWIICPNNGGYVPDRITEDPRVKVFPISDDEIEKYNSIGRLKAFCCSKATGEVLIELDADDMLTPDALLEIHEAFEGSKIAFAYSNSASFQDKTWAPSEFSEYYGWKSRSFSYKNHELIEQIAWPPAAQSIRRIEWAPNHVRCWRKTAYDVLGGHDPEIRAGDDHDLVCRTYIEYGAKGMKHIDKCLYLYRVHEANSCVIFNKDVQDQTDRNYLKYIRQMAAVWADDNGYDKLDLGGRFNSMPGYTSVDKFDADVNTDLDLNHWPFPDDSVGVIMASHIFEHLKDPVRTMNEAFRILAPGGWLFIDVPSTDGRGAFQDPTHVSFWNQNSIWYYTNRDFAKFIQPKYKGRFQLSRITTFFPNEFHEQNDIPIVQADLIALKTPYSTRPAGEILI